MPLLFGVMDSAGGVPLGGSIATDSLYSLMTINGTNTSTTTPTSGGTLSVNGVSFGSYDYSVKSGNQTVSSFTNSDWFTTTEDTRSSLIVVKGDLTINSGQTFTPSNRKLFTCIYVTGTLTVNGSISMTARGANHSGTGNSGGATTAGAIRLHTGTFSSVTNPQIPSSGGSGANGVSPAALNVGVGGATGTSGSAGGTGGGGSGASWQRNTTAPTFSGNASAGTSFSGGSGTGGAGQDQTYPSGTRVGDNAIPNGGAGGDALAFEPAHGGGSDAAGGAGNPGGLGRTAAGGTPNQLKPANNGGAGTGGVLIVFCNTLAGSGTISANGVSGGSATVLDGPAGGGSGGGSVTVFYQSDSSSVTIQANGGPGGSSPNANGFNTSGGAGGAGTARKLALI
jgi:hypothetical protein